MSLLNSKFFKKWIAPPLITTTVLVIMFLLGVIFAIGKIKDYQQVLIAFGATVTAGIILGLVYPIVRMPFRNLGRIGDILTGIFLVNIYFLGFMVVDNFDWENWVLKNLEFSLFMHGFATVGGIILGWDRLFSGFEQLGKREIIDEEDDSLE